MGVYKMTKYINCNICIRCGGKCCKNMGCQFSPDDFPDLSYKALKKEIQQGHISIDWWVGDIDTKKNRLEKTYYLRMRNKGYGIVDGSWGGQCALWNPETGCPLPFEKRPKGARMLIPRESKPCDDHEYTKEMAIMDWRKHYKTLKRLAAFFSKQTVNEWKRILY